MKTILMLILSLSYVSNVHAADPSKEQPWVSLDLEAVGDLSFSNGSKSEIPKSNNLTDFALNTVPAAIGKTVGDVSGGAAVRVGGKLFDEWLTAGIDAAVKSDGYGLGAYTIVGKSIYGIANYQELKNWQDPDKMSRTVSGGVGMSILPIGGTSASMILEAQVGAKMQYHDSGAAFDSASPVLSLSVGIAN